MNEQLGQLITWTKDASKGVDGLLVPISGGTDSALTLWICSKALPDKVIGVHTNNEPLRAREWHEQRAKIIEVDTPGDKVEIEEMRWARFLNMSIVRSHALVGSRTRTEDLLGTYSLASRVATIQPLIGTWKTDVMRFCKEIGVPDEVIQSSYQADCDCGRPERMSCITLEARDNFLRKTILGEDVDISDISEDDQTYLQGVLDYTSFKSNLPFRGPTL